MHLVYNCNAVYLTVGVAHLIVIPTKIILLRYWSQITLHIEFANATKAAYSLEIEALSLMNTSVI